MTYKIRSFANGTNANGDPNLTFSLTVPAHIGRRLGEDARFMCEVRDDGILYRPITAAPERPLPAWLAGDGDDERAAAPGGAGADRYDRDELIGCLRTAAALAGGRLTQRSWDRVRSRRTLRDGRPWPGSNVIAARFGNWTPALEAAGLPTNDGRPVTWTRTRCIEALQRVAAELGRIPTSGEYPRRDRPDLPSYPTLQAHLGPSWCTIVARAFPAGEHPHA